MRRLLDAHDLDRGKHRLTVNKPQFDLLRGNVVPQAILYIFTVLAQLERYPIKGHLPRLRLVLAVDGLDLLQQDTSEGPLD